MSPLGAILGSGLNGGWYNTAKSHSLGGFDITAGLHIISIPNSAETFNPSMTLTNFKFKVIKIYLHFLALKILTLKLLYLEMEKVFLHL